MKRWIALVLGWLLLAGAGCMPGGVARPSRLDSRDPVQVIWEVATAYQRTPALDGESVIIDGWSATVTARFSAPVPLADLRPRVEGGTWRLIDLPAQIGERAVTFRLRADLAGNTPVTLALDGAAPTTARLTLQPRTPALTEEETVTLRALGLRIWTLAAAGDEPGLQALLAPEAHLTAPGGEFHAEGFGQGLPAVLRWVRTRGGAHAEVAVAPRQSYASMDLILVETGKGTLAIYVTIPGRRLAKLYGI